MRRATRYSSRRVALGALLLCVGCAGQDLSDTAFTPPVSGTVTVLPSRVSLVVGGSQALTVTASGGAAGRPVTWGSANSAVATVSAGGVVTGVATGETTVTADVSGIRATVVVDVSPAPPPAVATVSLTPTSASVAVGGTAQLEATMRSGDGTVLTGRAVGWTSSAPAVALVSPTGLVTAVSSGLATITAQSEGRSAAASITVVPGPVATITLATPSSPLFVGGTLQLAVTLADAAGTSLTDRPVSWTSTTPSVAGVSTTGLVSGLAPGSTTITATSEGRSASVLLTVQPAPVASLLVTPATAALVVGGTRAMTAVVLDANGGVLTGRTVNWTSTAPAVASVSDAGGVTALTPGTTVIVATSEGRSATATVTVTPVPVATLQVTPGASTITSGGTQQLVATARDADGQLLTGRTVSWQSGTPSVATVSEAGLVSALTAGTTTITATSEGVPGTATITVLPPAPAPVATVTLNATVLDAYVGRTFQFEATLRSASGTVLSGRTVDWATSAPSVVMVSANGAVSVTGDGTATITAASEGVSATATITAEAVAGVLILESSGPTVRRFDWASQAVTTLVNGKHGMLNAAGSALVFSDNGNCIARANADGSAVSTLFCGGSNYVPVFHPDGQRIVFSRQPGCGNASCQDLFSMTTAGGDLIQLTTAAGDDNFPQVSGDGSLLAWSSSRDGNYEVYVMPMAGGAQTRLAAHAGEDLYPRFIPGTSSLLFRSNRGGGPDLYRMTSTGGQLTRLTYTGNVNGFAISPSGRFVAYNTTGGSIRVVHLPSGDVVRSVTQAGWVFDWR